MPVYKRVDTGCLFVADYMDEGDIPTDTKFSQGEVVRTHVVGKFVDVNPIEVDVTNFIVLLKTGQTITVKGHTLKHLPHSESGQDFYSIVVQNGDEETLVAIFKSQDISGIFTGQIDLGKNLV